MQIKYTAHLEFRLKIRKIPYHLPRKILENTQEHFYDKLTRHFIAVGQTKFEGKLREMVVAYDKQKI